MKLLEKLNAAWSLCGITPGTTVLCALSGGADSVCLLSLLRVCGIPTQAAHVNHMIRGADADRDEAFCRDLCERWGIPFHSTRIDVPARAKASGRGIEEEARAARYAYLVETANAIACNADRVVIATAHHASDNAETVLFNLARGTGLAGAAGIPMVRVHDGVTIVRPLLTAAKSEILEYLAAEGIEYILDASNLDETYARNFIRGSILPALTRVNPQAVENIARSAVHLREDLDFIGAAVDAAMEGVSFAPEGALVSAGALGVLHPAVAKRVVASMYRYAAGAGAPSLAGVHLDAVLGIAAGVDPSAEVTLPVGVTAWRQYDALCIGKKRETTPFFAEIRAGETVKLPGFTVRCKKSDVIYNNLNTFTVDCSKIHGILSVRPRREGDTIRPVGRNWTKTVKKAMIDAKIPRHLRDAYPVLVCGGRVVAVYGVGCDAGYAASADTDADKRLCISITADAEKIYE